MLDRRYYLLGLLVATIFLVSCNQAPLTPPATPLPTPEWSGHLLLRGYAEAQTSLGESQFYELHLDSATGELVTTLAVQGFFDNARLSPDASHLLYTNSEEILLTNLLSGETRTLATGNNIGCVSWSPDGTTFSVKIDHDLFAINLSGEQTKLTAEASADYTPGGTVYGSLNCGEWIGNDRLLIQRRAGMPGVIRSNETQGGKLLPDTTSLVILGDPLIIHNNPATPGIVQHTFWSVVDMCEDGSLLLMVREGGGEEGRLFLAAPFDSFETFKPLAITLSPAMYAYIDDDGQGQVSPPTGFVSGATDCTLYSVDGDDIYLIDPDTLRKQVLYTLSEGETFSGRWIGNPEDGMIVLMNSIGGFTDSVSILNLNDGSKSTVRIEAFSIFAFDSVFWLP
jgi:hypothetical protein